MALIRAFLEFIDIPFVCNCFALIDNLIFRKMFLHLSIMRLFTKCFCFSLTSGTRRLNSSSLSNISAAPFSGNFASKSSISGNLNCATVERSQECAWDTDQSQGSEKETRTIKPNDSSRESVK